MNSKFEGGAKGDARFDDLVELIEYDSSSLAILTQDQGFVNLRICFFANLKNKHWDLPCVDFLETLTFARSDLYSYRRDDDEKIDLSKAIEIENPILKFQNARSSNSEIDAAKIYFENNCVAEICGNSTINLRIFIYSNPNKLPKFDEIQWDFLFQEFMTVLEEAKNSLLHSS